MRAENVHGRQSSTGGSSLETALRRLSEESRVKCLLAGGYLGQLGARYHQCALSIDRRRRSHRRRRSPARPPSGCLHSPRRRCCDRSPPSIADECSRARRTVVYALGASTGCLYWVTYGAGRGALGHHLFRSRRKSRPSSSVILQASPTLWTANPESRSGSYNPRNTRLPRRRPHQCSIEAVESACD